MSQNEYFRAPLINSSKLKLFWGDDFSPKKAVYDLCHPPEESKDCFVIGSAVHEALEFKGVLPDTYVILPFDSLRTKDSKEWKASKEAGGKIVLKESDYHALQTMVENVWTSCPIKDIIQNPMMKRELELYGTKFKAMIDLYGGHTLYDYKTTRHTTSRQIQNDAFKFGWHLQAHHYKKVAIEKGYSVDEFYFIVVSKVAPYETFVFCCDEGFMSRGEEDWNIALERYEQYHDKDWMEIDGSAPMIEVLSIPEFAERHPSPQAPKSHDDQDF